MGPLLPLLLVVAGLAPAIGQELLFAEEFDRLDTTRWQHIVSAAVSNNEFQYYTSRPENRFFFKGNGAYLSCVFNVFCGCPFG